MGCLSHQPRDQRRDAADAGAAARRAAGRNDALRAAVLRLNNDPAFAEEARKVVGFVPEYVAGPDTNRQVRSALA